MSDFSSGYFCVHTESAGELRSFSAGSRAGQHVLKIEVVYTSASEMGYAVDNLAKLQASIKTVKAGAKARAKRKPLMLPAPKGWP